jgi:hypothetical protein
VVERRNRGFTLIHAETGVPIARLRPIGRALQLPSNRPCASSQKRRSFGPASEAGGKKSAKSSFDLVQETTERRASDGAPYTSFGTTDPQPSETLAALAPGPAKPSSFK